MASPVRWLFTWHMCRLLSVVLDGLDVSDVRRHARTSSQAATQLSQADHLAFCRRSAPDQGCPATQDWSQSKYRGTPLRGRLGSPRGLRSCKPRSAVHDQCARNDTVCRRPTERRRRAAKQFAGGACVAVELIGRSIRLVESCHRSHCWAFKVRACRRRESPNAYNGPPLLRASFGLRAWHDQRWR